MERQAGIPHVVAKQLGEGAESSEVTRVSHEHGQKSLKGSPRKHQPPTALEMLAGTAVSGFLKER